MISIARKSLTAVALAGGLLLAACEDYIANSLGINGSPSWNVPMELEGDWSGRALPENVVDCLQADSYFDRYTVEIAPRLSVAIRQTTLTGQLVFADGEAYDLSGETGAGASFTGNNVAFADIRLNGQRVGNAQFEPDGSSGRLAVILFLKRPASRDHCLMPATLSRVE